MSGEHIDRTVEAYVDVIVVKTRKASNLLTGLETTFKCLKAKGVKLNAEKCVFGVPRGMLLGFIVSERGIKAKPEKIVAITNMGPIKELKGVQRVMGCLAALSRFISRLGDPSAKTHSSAATAAQEPPEEPPGTCSVFHGFFVSP